MLRVLWVFPGLDLRIHSFGVMLLLACAGALTLASWRARRERLDPDIIHGLVPWLFLGGIIGARILFVIMHPEQVHGLASLLRFWQGGIIFYGCILGGLIGSTLYWTRRRFPFLATADAVAPGLALGVAVGRIGCFLNGCCYGSLCDRAWAVRFPAGTLPWIHHVQASWISSGAAWSLPVHPKQLYAALFGCALLILVSLYYARRRRDGEVMALLMIGYPITRFVLEFFRGDAGGLYAGLAISQYISVGVLVSGLATWYWLSGRPAVRYADIQGRPETGFLPRKRVSGDGPRSSRRAADSESGISGKVRVSR
jgi:phosphatidylglycerol:prolipoprotein diacylglycerol transferase